MILECAGKSLDLSRAAIMGVINITPDSFSDGGRFFNYDDACWQARTMLDDGADIIDIGGESTRPGAKPVPLVQELDRVIPVIEHIAGEMDCIISVDTSKPEVMRAAVSAGAGLINDVCALGADGAIQAAAQTGVPVCLMHMQGSPRTMQANPCYDDVVEEVRTFLLERAAACEAAGISKNRIIIDPGFGFGKTVAHNVALLNHLDDLCTSGYPVLAGLSRKAMIGALLGLPVDERMAASLALAITAVQKGARIIRSHDVRHTRDAIRMIEALQTQE